MGVKVVTGYIEIPTHPRGPHDYKALGAELLDALGDTEALVFDSPEQRLVDTFLGRYIKDIANLGHAVADNPAKNSKAYHCVQHQKFEWLRTAHAMDDGAADVYVWIDYGIMHLKNKGVTAAVIQKFLDKAQDFAHVTMPGCWLRKPEIDDSYPCWRFCGGVIAVPRTLIRPFTQLAMATAIRRIHQTMSLTWETNSLAHLELTDQIPILWYKADHDGSMFENAP